MTTRIFRLLAIGLLMLAQAARAEVSASVDRDRIYEGDTLTLILESDGNVQGSPDLTPLQGDFEVLGTGRSSNIRIINGQQSISTGWQIRLRPRRLGDLIVPPLSVGGEKTRPLVVHVGKVPPEVARKNAEQLFVETEIDSGGHPPYVQQQVKLTVRLYYRVRLLDGELSEPTPDGDVVFERLGDDKRYETVRNGKRYKVIEREYAMFPQRSGELHIPSVVFSGHAALRRPARSHRPSSRLDSLMQRFFGDDPFMDDFFANSPFGARGKRLVARSPSQTLKVLPPPKDYHGSDWLPAAGIELHDSWTENPPQPRAGEPVTRVLTLRAKGLEASQLPQLEIAPSADYKVYPEPATSRNLLADGWVVGELRREFAIVPTHAGKLVLPPIRVHWWDTQQNKERDTVLPRWELSVLPGQGVSSTSSPATSAPEQKNDESAEAPAQSASALGPSPGSRDLGNRIADHWPWLAALMALLLALSVTWWTRRKRAAVRAAAGEPPATNPRAGNQAARAALREACQRNDTRALARALLQLARAEWPEQPPLDLRALARRLPDQAEILERLDRALFAGGTLEADDTRTLCEAFRNGLGQKAKHEEKKGREGTDLAPLYPG